MQALEATTPPKTVLVFDFLDFRQFLKQAYIDQKKKSAKFSHRYVAEKVGVASPSWFNDILKGRTRLHRLYVPALAKLFQLNPRESDYLELLLQYSEEPSLEGKNRLVNKMLQYRELNLEVQGEDKFLFYSQWHHAILRELLYIHSGDLELLAEAFDPPLTVEIVRDSLNLMERLGIVEKNLHGGYHPTSRNIVKDKRWGAHFALNHFQNSLALAQQRLTQLPKEQRDFSSVTFSLSAKGFETAQQVLAECREKLLKVAESDSMPEKVYQCNIQLFPATKIP